MKVEVVVCMFVSEIDLFELVGQSKGPSKSREWLKAQV